jgi:hypothetical protein
MAESKLALYRLEFATDLTSAKAPRIALGYMVESALESGARFLGLVSRKALTDDELNQINMKTWPQLKDLDNYMDELFRRAWDHVCEASVEDHRLGSEFVAREHPLYSALSFEPLRVAEFGVRLSGTVDTIHSRLYGKLHDFAKLLKPAGPEPVASTPVARAPVSTRAKEEALELA